MFQHITVCLDMRGCPNRCRHCWIGHAPNARLPKEALVYVAEAFRPFARRLTVYDWYREPDYGDDYREMWELCGRLSDTRPEHFELVSFWRLARDPDYGPYLASLGVRRAQLTLFGGRARTDQYTGRANAFDEILQAMEVLLQNRIAPRIQVFVNNENLGELAQVEALVRDLDLEARCRAFGEDFDLFLHQGSCDGENEKLYDIRVTPEDLEKIPPDLTARTLRYLQRESLEQVFGRTEQALCEELRQDDSTASLAAPDPVFYVDAAFNVYPNFTAPAPAWRLGNVRVDGAEAILKTYAQDGSAAQRTRRTIPLCDLAAAQGDEQSQRLFGREDYITYLLNRACRKACAPV